MSLSPWWRAAHEPVRAPMLPPGLMQCRVHEVAWQGPDDGCWCCEAGIPAVSRG